MLSRDNQRFGVCLFGVACVVVFGLSSGSRAATVDSKMVDVTVEEAAGVDRQAWPVTVGVPFAEGQLKDAAALRVSGPDSKPLPLQAQVTAKWPDGSVKWVLLDTQATLPASSKTALHLSWDARTSTAVPAAAAKLQVSADGTGVKIDTGAMSFKLTPTGGGIPEEVTINSVVVSKGGLNDLSYLTSGPAMNPPETRGNWKRPAPTDAKRVELSANGATAEVLVEQKNDLRATILVKGWYQGAGQKACRFDVRVTAFAGKPYVKIQHSFTFTEDPYAFFVRRIRLRFDVAGVQAAAFGGATGLHDVKPAEGAYMLSIGPEINHNGIKPADAPKKVVAYDVFDGAGKKLAGMSGQDPPGFVFARGANGAVVVSVRDFKHLHPKELAVDANGVEVDLWPEHGDLLIDCRNSLYGETIRGETTLAGVACGWAKTHEIWAAYGGKGGTDAKSGPLKASLDVARAAQEPAWGWADPAHVCASKTMGTMAAVNREKFPGMERQNETLWAWVQKNQSLFKWEGFFDFGGILIEFDNHNQRYSNGPPGTWVWRDYAGWILNDGQLVHQMFRAFVRSGERQYLKMAEASARQIGDETTIHYENPKVKGAHPLGSAHRHDMLPWGAVVTTYGMDVLGNRDLWFLTGDLRARDNLRDYAVCLAGGGRGLKECHAPGSLLCIIGEAVEDAKLIDKGKTLFDGECKEAVAPNFRTWTDTYMAMILAYGITRDAGLKSALLGAADVSLKKPAAFAAEIEAWAYLEGKDSKYLDGVKQCMALSERIPAAAANKGDPWKDDWPALRKRMDQMPGWYVKVYQNTQGTGRYASVILALQDAGLDEKALNLK